MTQTITEWFSTTSPYFIYLVPALAFLESCVGIGLFVSGVFLLSTTTLLYVAEPASLPAILMLAFTGALLGDHSGYLTGRVFGERIWDIPWLRHRQQTRLSAQIQLMRSAPLAICIGRFIPLLRSITPVGAGVSGLSWRRFLACDVLACAIWTGGLYLILTNLTLIPFPAVSPLSM